MSGEADHDGFYEPGHWGVSLGKARDLPMIRKPGDLPSKMVMDEAKGRGAPDAAGWFILLIVVTHC
ncbi:hypothetical protein AA0229_0493 [Gluconobacter cerinus NRIC 0229]|uniref:Uncharacterized protein n=1 Tax=Gluconobacter cerinus TaxID=38307 RepID=A0AAV5NCM9_9PROT|nr:hypothetical protein [Gluconobacter cerinus]GBQ97283.1 hypothetical protein AA0229_0493 [Gluconobacter cerinus NRIC 0229]GLQ61909.1 hypothetical protein GCM10007867_07540 [Gluconobacter cerinus]